jgi:hypothetical protein
VARFLPIAVNNAGVSLEEILPVALGGSPSLEDYSVVCKLYRQLGVGSLLMSGDPRELCAHLFRSGRAFVHFSETAQQAEKLTSRAEPFFDALACRDDEGARRMALASPRTVDPSREYDEEFYAVRCPMDLLLGEPPPAVLAMLDAWVKLASEPDPRADLWRAILEKDQKAFDQALPACIDARRAAYQELMDAERLDPDEAATLPHVSVEALAALELAERAGLKTARDYPTAPAVARKLALVTHPPPDSWKVLDEEYSALD